MRVLLVPVVVAPRLIWPLPLLADAASPLIGAVVDNDLERLGMVVLGIPVIVAIKVGISAVSSRVLLRVFQLLKAPAP